MYYGRPNDKIIGDSMFVNCLDKLDELKEEAKKSKKTEFKMWIQFAELEPVTFHGKNPDDNITYYSHPMGLVATIKKEDLLNFGANNGTIPVTFKKEDIQRYERALFFKGFGDDIQPPKEIADYEANPDQQDVQTELDFFTLSGLYTDMQKVFTSPEKKYTRKELENYARLHGPLMLFKLIKELKGREQGIAIDVFLNYFGYGLLEMLDNKKTKTPEEQVKFNKKYAYFLFTEREKRQNPHKNNQVEEELGR